LDYFLGLKATVTPDHGLINDLLLCYLLKFEPRHTLHYQEKLFDKVTTLVRLSYLFILGVVMFYPCVFCPSDNVWCSRHADGSGAALFYCFHTFLDHTTIISRKVRALRHVSVS